MKFNSIILIGVMPLIIAVAACDYTPPTSQSAIESEVGATGNIQYTFDKLNEKRNLLTVTAAPGLGETESSIRQRMFQFAVRFAASTCPVEYDFINDPNMEQSTAAGFMRRTRSYIFDCT